MVMALLCVRIALLLGAVASALLALLVLADEDKDDEDEDDDGPCKGSTVDCFEDVAGEM